jgi:hypothetical protein
LGCWDVGMLMLMLMLCLSLSSPERTGLFGKLGQSEFLLHTKHPLHATAQQTKKNIPGAYSTSV